MTASSKPEPLLVWLDLETGGLQPAESAILEISAMLTSMDGSRQIGERYHRVLSIGPWSDIDDYCRQLHTKNHLLEECDASDVWLSTAVADFQSWIAQAPTPLSNIHPAGYSVWNDIVFLRAQAPDLIKGLNHRLLDVTACIMAITAVDPDADDAIYAEAGQTDHRSDTCIDVERRAYQAALRYIR